ncbi:hypothetical protein LTR57_025240, partial [Friedmanniomyces endolithicus]
LLRVPITGIVGIDAATKRHAANPTICQSRETLPAIDDTLTPFLEGFKTFDWPKYLDEVDWSNFRGGS